MNEPAEPVEAGTPGHLRPKRKIAIIGKAPSSRHLAPYQDPAWEVWTLSDLVPIGQSPRSNCHFELHPLDWLRAERPEYFRWLASVTEIPILLQKLDPEIPAGRLYPLKAVLRHFRRRYFTNQVSWMIALAILQRPAAIGIWGVDMCVRSPVLDQNEYGNQRPSCEWLIGWAEGAGIEMVIPEECELLKHPYLYGFDHRGGAVRVRWEARQRELEGRLARQQEKADQAQARHNQHLANVMTLRGALDAHAWAEQFSFPDPAGEALDADE